jgi:hypothetical protein
VRTLLLTAGLPTGPVWRAGEATVAARPGPHVCGQARQREGGRSTPSETASRWGPTWGVWAVLITCPVAVRPWARPVWVAL